MSTIEHLTVFNDNIPLIDLLNKYESGKIITTGYCGGNDHFGVDVGNILNGLYNPVVWLLEDSTAKRTLVYKSEFIDFLSRFHKNEVPDGDGVKFSEYKTRLQNKFEDSNFIIKTISYHPELDVVKVLMMLAYNH